MPDELKLRYQARAVIRSGRLPLRKPDRMFGGPGSGAVCPVCDELAAKKELELEIEFDRHGVVDRFHLHPGASQRGNLNEPRSLAQPTRSRICRPDLTD